jgi:hypothetical protein
MRCGILCRSTRAPSWTNPTGATSPTVSTKRWSSPSQNLAAMT